MTESVTATEWLFAYGTLQDPAVQKANFGRALTGRADILPGYDLRLIAIRDPGVVATSGKDQHPIIQPSTSPGAEVAGTVFLLTAQELAAADEYEVAEYKRIAVMMKSGLRAWAYVRA